MDLIKTGEFIAERRKAKKLTQLRLAEILCVSEKTISKWECGKGFPDTSLMLPLCKALDISANELLSAKLLDEKEYREQAENNLLLIKSSQENNAKFMITIEYIFCSISVILGVGLILIAALIEMPTWLRLTVFILTPLIISLVCIFAVRIEQKAGFYECRKCHHKYIPTYKSALFAMHIDTTRFMKCPHCHKWSWSKKTTKMD